MTVILTRRGFLLAATATAGALGLSLAWARETESTAIRLSLRVAFDADGTLVVTSGKSEMGQGILSGFAQIVADEIGADWSRVRAQTGPVDPEFRPPGVGEQITGGSMSIRLHHSALRLAGAAAREMLIAEAASRWSVDPAHCATADHSVVESMTGRRLDFASLAAGAAARPVPLAPVPRPASRRRLTGLPLPRIDIPAKVDGSAVFGIDVRLPGMVFASIRHPPVKGARIASIDRGPLLLMPGLVDVVDLGDAVAVVADRWWRAEKAAKAVSFTTTPTAFDHISSTDIEETLRAAISRDHLPVAVDIGPPLQRAAADKVVSVTVSAPLLPHATMEPMSCAAWVRSNACDVWAPTQGQDAARRAAAAASGLSEAAVTIHTTLMGGGFGRRYEWDFVTQAVRISAAVGRPVSLLWPREEDVRHDFYRPPAVARLTGSLSRTGRLSALDIVAAQPSANLHAWPGAVVDGVDRGALDGLIDLPYEVPGLRIRQAITPIHLNVGFWRAVGFSHNVPFLEAFMDEAAAAAGIDPVDFRLHHLAHDERGSRVLKRCAELLAQKGPDADEAVGVAFGRPMLTPTAVAVLAKRAGDRLAVSRVVVVVDCGLVINPDTVRAQAEGGVIFGILAALDHRVAVKDGSIVQSNFHDVPLMKVADVPEMLIDIVPSDADPTGIGEATTPVTIAAVARAASLLLGRPVHALPIHQG